MQGRGGHVPEEARCSNPLPHVVSSGDCNWDEEEPSDYRIGPYVKSETESERHSTRFG